MNYCHFISALTRVNSKVAAKIFYNTTPFQFVLVQNYIKGFRIVTTKRDTPSFTRVKTYIPPLSIIHGNVMQSAILSWQIRPSVRLFCLSVYLSVCLSHSSIVSKQTHIVKLFPPSGGGMT